jgi:hypothetical protein
MLCRVNDKIRRIRCGTPKCAGFFDTRISTVAKSADGNWQFHCTSCGFWSLASATGMVKATARDAFNLDQLPSSLRFEPRVTREPPGGV